MVNVSMEKLKETTEKKYSSFNRIIKSDALQALLNKRSEGAMEEFISDWKWIFGYSKKYKWAIVIYTLVGIVSSSLGIGASVLTKYVIDVIVNKKIDQLWLLACLMIFSTVFSLIFSSVVSRLSAKISIYVNNDIRANIFEKIMDAEWLSLNKYESGDVLNRFSNDIRSVSANAVNWLPDLIIQVYTFTATFVVICYYDITMALIALISAPFLLISGKYILRKMQMHKKKVLEVNSQMMGFEVEAFYNYDTIKSFGVTGHYRQKLHKLQKKYEETNLDYNLFTIKSHVWMKILNTLVSFVAFGYCLFLLWNGKITYGTMMLFLQQRNKLSVNFDSLVKILPNMVNSAVAAHRVREIAELPKEVHHDGKAKEIEAVAKQGISVQMRDVSFSYIEDKKVLNSSNFAANPGEIIALVGASGEGKTTILRMILGLINPQEGEAILRAGNGEEYPANADFRKLFAYVPQGNTLFAGSIAENLRLIKEDATDEEVIEALKTSCAWEFVQKIEGGIYAKLGDRGKGISEGQAQRIAIARAILRDAPILLLDEATSALDAETERKVLENIMKQCPNKTCIVSTHRPSVLNMCQRVYRVLDTKVRELDRKGMIPFE